MTLSRKVAAISILVTTAALLIASNVQPPGGAARAQQPAPTGIGIDADPSGNTATSLGTIDDCASIRTSDTQEIDIFVTDVTDLLAWEAYLVYDPAILEIVDRDVTLFQGANEGSTVQDVSEDVPDDDGRYQLAAFDSADPMSPDSGSGTLARVTVRAVGSGVSPLSLPLTDVDSDGAPDQGPFLRDADGEPIGDENGDTLFDGQIVDAKIAVDESCSGVPLQDATASEDDDGISTALVVGLAVGGAAILLLFGLGMLRMRKRRGQL